MVRTMLLFGLLVLAAGSVMLWREYRPSDTVPSSSFGNTTRTGQSALSHGTPDAGPPAKRPGRLEKPLPPPPFNETTEASKR